MHVGVPLLCEENVPPLSLGVFLSWSNMIDFLLDWQETRRFESPSRSRSSNFSCMFKMVSTFEGQDLINSWRKIVWQMIWLLCDIVSCSFIDSLC